MNKMGYWWGYSQRLETINTKFYSPKLFISGCRGTWQTSGVLDVQNLLPWVPILLQRR